MHDIPNDADLPPPKPGRPFTALLDARIGPLKCTAVRHHNTPGVEVSASGFVDGEYVSETVTMDVCSPGIARRWAEGVIAAHHAKRNAAAAKRLLQQGGGSIVSEPPTTAVGTGGAHNSHQPPDFHRASGRVTR